MVTREGIRNLPEAPPRELSSTRSTHGDRGACRVSGRARVAGGSGSLQARPLEAAEERLCRRRVARRLERRASRPPPRSGARRRSRAGDGEGEQDGDEQRERHDRGLAQAAATRAMTHEPQATAARGARTKRCPSRRGGAPRARARAPRRSGPRRAQLRASSSVFQSTTVVVGRAPTASALRPGVRSAARRTSTRTSRTPSVPSERRGSPRASRVVAQRLQPRREQQRAGEHVRGGERRAALAQAASHQRRRAGAARLARRGGRQRDHDQLPEERRPAADQVRGVVEVGDAVSAPPPLVHEGRTERDDPERGDEHLPEQGGAERAAVRTSRRASCRRCRAASASDGQLRRQREDEPGCAGSVRSGRCPRSTPRRRPRPHRPSAARARRHRACARAAPRRRASARTLASPPIAMRVAVISDIHANLPALDAVLAAIEAEPPDEIWCLGDIVGYGPQPNEVLRARRGARRRLPRRATTTSSCSARSTLEDFTDEARRRGALDAERAAPRTRAPILVAARAARRARDGVGLFHASPRDPVWEYVLTRRGRARSLALTPSAARARRPQPRRAGDRRSTTASLHGGLAPDGTEIDLDGGRWLLNPGSVGQPRDGDPRAAWLVLDRGGTAPVPPRRVPGRADAGRDPRARVSRSASAGSGSPAGQSRHAASTAVRNG